MPPKKSKGKKKDDDWGDDEAIEAKIASLAIEVDEEISAPIINKNKKKKKGFALIVEDIEDEIEIEDKKSDESEVDESTEAQMERAKEFFKKQKTKKKEKGKKAKKAAKEEEEADFDSIIATLKDSKDKPKKKKDVDSLEIEKVDEIKKEDDVNVKKTVDKKDSEPIKKEADVEGEPQKVSKKKKKAGKDKKKGDDDKGEEKVSQIKEDNTIKEEEPVGEKEDDKDSGKKQKKVNKKMAALKLLLEAQEKAKEEAEKKAKEAEALWEAREKEREEKARLEEERRAKIKAEKKEREAQLKKEGKWLTPAQRLAQQRAKELLEARGIKLPVTDEKKDVPVDGKRKAFLYDTKKKKQQQNQQHKKKEEMKKIEEEKIAAEKMKVESEEKNKQEEILDDWEMADDIEKEKKPEISKHSSKDEESEEESESDEDEDDEEESDEESSEESEDETHLNKMTKEEIDNMVRARFKKRKTLNDSKKSTDNLRSPVICVLGHVDTGKTKMLDTIRRTNVQLGEAGGITQQIGATFVPGDAIKERCKMVKTFNKDKMKIPGFLIIDTPGHESFANLRTRGSSLCDIAILVVDIMHGLEPQTIESIKLLLKRNTPFVVALNKIDRLYGYESNPRRDIWEHLDSQPSNTQLEFKERFQSIFAQFAEQGLNIALAKDNDDVEEYISVIPTSAFLGDGIGNIMGYVSDYTQNYLAKKIAFSNELECFVMEVRAIPGLGTTIDVILLNGTLKSGDIIVLTGTDGAIITQVRDLLMPSPLKEIRVKNEYQRFKSIKGAQGVKILAKNLEKAVAGLPLFVANREDEIEILKEDAETQLEKALTAIKRKPEGVYVQASTLGSLEALLEFLKSQKIPYSNVNIGPVHKKDVQKAAVMLEHNPEFACILAFDVKVERDAQLFADKENVKIFQADIIYHLEDAFLKYREDLREKKRKENEHLAIFPCKLRILPQNIFNARNPIICGVYVEAGQLKKGTPICVPSKDNIILGTVSSIEKNHEDINIAKQGDEVCIKIENTTGDAPKLYGRHFTHEDTLISKITRETIDVCKAYYREDLTKSDWQLIVQLKKILDIY